MKSSVVKSAILVLIAVIVAGYCLPSDPIIPVANASSRDYNNKSFWYHLWGVSGVHKGVDIFAPKGTGVVASTAGVVIYRGTIRLGGNVLLVLGPHWKVQYYAHLDSFKASRFDWVGKGEQIGTVGNSGNAAGKTGPSALCCPNADTLPLENRRHSTGLEENVLSRPRKGVHQITASIFRYIAARFCPFTDERPESCN